MANKLDCYIDKSDYCFEDIEIPQAVRQSLLQSQDYFAMEQTIMDLFYKSEFYEKTSNNEELRTQLVTVGFQERLKQMTGIQFVMTKAIPAKSLFWIEKRNRKSASQWDVVSIYYVLNFVIYQAPTLSHIIDTRINNSIFYTKKAFEIVQQGSEILYSEPTSWKELNGQTNSAQTQTTTSTSDQTNEEAQSGKQPDSSMDFIFEIAQNQIEDQYHKSQQFQAKQ